MRVLKLNKAHLPQDWISREEAAVLYAKNLVIWEYGSHDMMYGGINRETETVSSLRISPIIACKGHFKMRSGSLPLNNRTLFKRDSNICMYCGREYPSKLLTRDHIVPKVQNGPDVWKNVTTSCKRCNIAKGGRTPEQAGMKLLAVPFEPNIFEWFFLQNHRILADQMEFLSSNFSGKRNWII